MFVTVMAYKNGYDLPPSEFTLNVDNIVSFWDGTIRLNGVDETPVVYLDTVRTSGIVIAGTAAELRSHIQCGDVNAALLMDPEQELAAQPQGTEARVCDDITERQALGIAKYGKTVEHSNASFRDWLQHAYEEALDMAIYLKRAIEKLDGK